MAKVKLLNSKDLTRKGEGSYGVYYHIKGTKTGVKIDDSDRFDSFDKAKNSISLWSISSEFKRLQKMSSKTRLVPKAISLAIVEFNDDFSTHYCAGYIMSHVYGETLQHYVDAHHFPNVDERLEKSRDKLLSYGIEWSDDHWYNVMATKQSNCIRLTFIDAGGMRLIKRRSRSKK